MTPNPKNRPTCQEALAHPWLNDRHNLEKRKRRDSTYLENPKWTAGQQAAFIICVFIIIGSYSALITYVFNYQTCGFDARFEAGISRNL